MYYEIGDYNALRKALQEMCFAFRKEFSEETVFNSKLVATELLSNVLQHGGGRAQLRVERVGNEIRICVRGENGYRPPEKSSCAELFAERGRGLYLVDATCERRTYSEEEGVIVFLKIE